MGSNQGGFPGLERHPEMPGMSCLVIGYLFVTPLNMPA
jgi:hypothetical protein